MQIVFDDELMMKSLLHHDIQYTKIIRSKVTMNDEVDRSHQHVLRYKKERQFTGTDKNYR